MIGPLMGAKLQPPCPAKAVKLLKIVSFRFRKGAGPALGNGAASDFRAIHRGAPATAGSESCPATLAIPQKFRICVIQNSRKPTRAYREGHEHQRDWRYR